MSALQIRPSEVLVSLSGHYNIIALEKMINSWSYYFYLSLGHKLRTRVLAKHITHDERK